ncbi:MAG: hypothetical protein Q8Q06_04225 [bacterium]|nr:hypothetical protein [bacterium]
MATEVTPSLRKLAEELINKCEYYNSLSTRAVGREDAGDNLYLLMQELVARSLLATAIITNPLRAGNFVLRNAVTYEPVLFGPGHIEIKFSDKDFALKCRELIICESDCAKLIDVLKVEER